MSWGGRATLPVLLLAGWLFVFSLPARAGNPSPQGGAYDVIVVGGDAEGVAAAIGAARAGASTLLIDTRPILGGLLTRGWLNTLDMNLDSKGVPLNRGIFGELYKKIEGTAFDLAGMVSALQNLVRDEPKLDFLADAVTVFPIAGSVTFDLVQPGQTLQPGSQAEGGGAPGTAPSQIVPSMAGIHRLGDPGRSLSAGGVELTGVAVVASDGTSRIINGKRFIDATQDADLACAAGASWTRYGEDVWGEPRDMAITLVFRLEGIGDDDWTVLRRAIGQWGGNQTLAGADNQSAWGFGDILKTYQPASPRVGVRALNIGRQKDSSVLINALQVFGCNGLDLQSRAEARRLAEAELPALIGFLCQRIPGFSHIRFGGTAPELYVRTTRNLLTQYTLTVDDVLENADFPDRICFGAYPLDIQATDATFRGDIVGKPQQYAIPLRSIIPRGFANLFVVGRSAGFDSLAQSSARTIPVGMAAGQGGGVAAAVSLRRNLPCDQLAGHPAAVADIQRLLIAQGVSLDPNLAGPPPETRHWAYPGLAFVRRHGLASGGYENAWHLDSPMPAIAFLNRLVRLRRDLSKPERQKIYSLLPVQENDLPLSLGSASGILAGIDNPKTSSAEAFAQLSRAGFFAPPWPARLSQVDSPLTYGSGYCLLHRYMLASSAKVLH